MDAAKFSEANSQSTNYTALMALANISLNYIYLVADQDSEGRKYYDLGKGMSSYRGTTELPGAETNPSKDDNIYILVGGILEPLQQCKSIAHEAYGHAYLYELTRNVKESSHQKRLEGTVKMINGVKEYDFEQIDDNKRLIELLNVVENEAKKNYEIRQKKR